MAEGGRSKKYEYYEMVSDLYVNPRYLRSIIEKESTNKKDNETYREYVERLRGRKFEDEEWENSCGISSKILETEVNTDQLDVTHLICLFENIFKEVHKDDVGDFPSNLLEKLRDVKIKRDRFFDNTAAAEDSINLGTLKTALSEVLKDVENFYSPLDDGQGQNQNYERRIFLDEERIKNFHSMLDPSNQQLRENIKNLVENAILQEELTSERDTVNSCAVFHGFDLLVKERNDERVPENTKIANEKILENSVKFVVVEGIAGSGKTTFLKNIILQFFNRPHTIVENLDHFDQLILFDLRERTAKTLSDVVKQLFGDLCGEQEKENVLEAILRRKVIFVLDSFDDVNTDSYKIVKEIIARSWRTGSRVLITTRPHCKERLKKLLSKNDVSSIVYGINPISKLEDQVEFLKMYENSSNEANQAGVAMIEKFKSLEPEVRTLFTEPVNLMLFRLFHLHFPEKILSWHKSMGIAYFIFGLYRKIAVSKLQTPNSPEGENMLDEMFKIIGRVALELLHDNFVTFSEDKYQEIKTSCRIQGVNEEAENIILGVVLKKHRTVAENAPQFFEFRHKIIQETFAAHYIVERIFDEQYSPLNSIIDKVARETRLNPDYPLADASHGNRTSSKHRFPRNLLRETLQYVVLELNRRSPSRFQQRWPELQEALRDAGIENAFDWQDCLRLCAGVKLVAEIAALKRKDEDTWFVNKGLEVAAIAAMLQYVQPKSIHLTMRSEDLDLTQWKKLVRRRKGDILLVLNEHEGDEYKTHDDLLQPLNESKIRIVRFDGCVSHPDSVTALASKAHEAEINIRMADPLDLRALSGKYKKLNVRTRQLPSDATPMPLPDTPAPSLQVDGADERFKGAVAHTITLLAPQNKRFLTLKLQPSKVEWRSTLRELHALGIRTEEDDRTRVPGIRTEEDDRTRVPGITTEEDDRTRVPGIRTEEVDRTQAHGPRTQEGDRTRLEETKLSGLINIYIREELPEKVEVIKVEDKHD
ncbi:uncharacterized protein LOC108672291 [Hyalella azteca]|uniref:Uncharacterized protein LOC108672291 n=1 Tax=Hyalella azteca TaxID=294128 RepID=A0A8B7NQR8_HYAAZ|nr:uncharacterized protein LOC108672291 [Hyalella azteca]